jgi:hypothetical protein
MERCWSYIPHWFFKNFRNTKKCCMHVTLKISLLEKWFLVTPKIFLWCRLIIPTVTKNKPSFFVSVVLSNQTQNRYFYAPTASLVPPVPRPRRAAARQPPSRPLLSEPRRSDRRWPRRCRRRRAVVADSAPMSRRLPVVPCAGRGHGPRGHGSCTRCARGPSRRRGVGHTHCASGPSANSAQCTRLNIIKFWFIQFFANSETNVGFVWTQKIIKQILLEMFKSVL